MKSVLPTKRQVVAELEKHIASWKNCTDYADDELHTIRCLEMALLIVKEHVAPTQRKRR